MLPIVDIPPVRWWITDFPIPYEESNKIMENEVQIIARGDVEELVWVLEHPAMYTGGTSANCQDLLSYKRFPVYRTGRGGGYTYHGPGQLTVYCMLNLKKRNKDIRCFIASLEEIIIRTLKQLGITGERREDRVGIWVVRPQKTTSSPLVEEKIAAIGIRIKKWVSFHGFSINIDPDLSHYDGIIPCGINKYGVTSLKDLGFFYTKEYVHSIIRESFESIFGPTELREYKKQIPLNPINN
ncbi:MAG: lipoate-protein ligase B [Candidatus Liberibacter europaeus]|uniref:Octanoyltransferase n=1 Tax=Candidatus Liberibacter europaeus TaxID=744859 RepID=A0A2T4VYI5_9HYPH|nr:lipoyl(octanoyl) transferase LipB [Candidatus Liberibacter europaeus]PTL86849.1 MAG: lipoate-protein ligase B [Candidatus Liberibacter europaeus]